MQSENLCKPDPSYIRDIRTPRHKFLSARYKQLSLHSKIKYKIPDINTHLLKKQKFRL